MKRETTTSRPTNRTGFTLIEMLMAVTLVLIMMVMFAEVFQLAGGSVTKQRTLADNDQNARTFVTILRGDLDKRTFQDLVPFQANEPIAVTRSEGEKKYRGYFYLSNNNLGDGTDDVLQFTVDSNFTVKNQDTSEYFGAASQLPVPQPALWTANPSLRVFHFLRNTNQPDYDDGHLTGNGAAASSTAEVCYFMRGTRLYRRVMLVRKPRPQAGSSDSGQPTISEDFNLNGMLDAGEDVNGNSALDRRLDYFAYPSPTYPLGYNPLLTGTSFWGQFDFSAFQRSPTLATVLPAGARFPFVTEDRDWFLENKPIAAFPQLSTYCYSLGQSWNRFGFNSAFTVNNPANGLPREFSGITLPNFFVGRFTQEETSNSAFQYPLVMPASGNPMDAAVTPLTDANLDGAIDGYVGGSRIGADLLLSNVHEFRVEVWDERIGDFAPVGHGLGGATNPGDYGAARQLNNTFGPLIAAGTVLPNVFDTWHPLFDRNMNGVVGDIPDRPPYRPLTWDPTLPATITGSPPGPTPPGNPFSSLRGYWAPNTNYSLGNVVFPLREDLNGNGYLDPGEDGKNGFATDGLLQENVRIGDEDLNGNGILDMGEDTNGNMVLDRGHPPGVLTEDLNANGVLDAGEDGTWGFPTNGVIDTPIRLREPSFPSGLKWAFVCTKAGTSGATRLHEPGPNMSPVSSSPGTWSRSEPLPGGAGVPDWQLVTFGGRRDNLRPLRAIRITVRFEHPTSQQMKQVTIVHSLVDQKTME